MPSPASLIAASGKTLMQIATEGSMSITCVITAKKQDRWPAQQRTRRSLARVLGLTVDPVTGHPLAAQVAP